MKRPSLWLGVLALGLTTLGCYYLFDTQGHKTMTTLQTQNLLDKVIQPGGHHPIHYVSMQLQGPDQFSGAAGRVPETGEAITVGHAFRIASISKLFTATLVLQLIEEGRLALSDRIADRLSGVRYVHPDRLHRFGGHDYGQSITVEHLLRHTSGLADYIDNEAFLANVMANPQQHWSAETIMQCFEELKLADKAVAPPGERMHYADTNYVLLAILIEQLTDKPLHQNLTERIFEPLGMDNTYLEFYQPPRGQAPLLYPYVGELSLRHINTSFDWGGGGLVSTHADLHRFIRNLVGGRLFRKPTTLTQMTDFRPENNARFMLGSPTSDYGLGIRRLRFGSYTLIGHSGSWGCVLYYDPEKDVSLSVAVNQMQNDGVLSQLIRQTLLTSEEID
ncbi:beta-lactamase [Fibrisoma limi BUZ 3]|uniref:Beta-lactamase n=1 Tax=Fibrisoma limi BUZ 3 TaxID=1185876 RepID=I2GD69_9BACT|nr:serine hydrolase domain-containing protein [Fibrisoma limi]CCH51843.1 beta-lactamase [Fibrisoma limi BUZ 3]